MSEAPDHRPADDAGGGDADGPIDMFIDWGLRGSAALRAHIGMSELDFVRVHGSIFEDCRGYFLYGVLDECQKAGVQLMQLRELLRGDGIDPHEDNHSRLVTESILESEQARERRLVEVLVNLVLFSATNEQAYFRHFLMVEDLAELVHSNEDLQEFHGARSGNVDASIEARVSSIIRHESNVDFSRVWYLNAPATPIRVASTSAKKLKSLVRASSMRSRMLAAMLLMRPTEKLSAGISYAEAYSRPSAGVHFSANAKSFTLRKGVERAHALKIGLLLGSILLRVHELMGGPATRVVDQITQALLRSDREGARDFVHAMINRGLEVGDFVLAAGDLAEVLEIVESPFGNRSYRILYLAERPIPGIEEDWIAARFVQPFFTRAKAEEGVRRLLKQHSLPDDDLRRLEESPHEFQKCLRESIVSLWPLMRADMKARPAAWGLGGGRAS